MTKILRTAILTILICFICFINVHSQELDVRFERLSIEEGLSQNGVICILQDSLGYLWFGTGDGLNKYNGYEFEVLRHSSENPRSLSDNAISSLFEDSMGIIWVGTLSGDESEFQDVDIHDGLDSTLALLHYEMKNRIEIKKEYGEIPKIHCFSNQINQVFMNVLSNAVQAIKEKGTIIINTKKENDELIIRISDDGKGIEKKDLEKIFDPRFTTKEADVGTSLWLPISKKIIESHKGRMKVKSEVGKGTEVSIVLPIKQI